MICARCGQDFGEYPALSREKGGLFRQSDIVEVHIPKPIKED